MQRPQRNRVKSKNLASNSLGSPPSASAKRRNESNPKQQQQSHVLQQKPTTPNNQQSYSHKVILSSWTFNVQLRKPQPSLFSSLQHHLQLTSTDGDDDDDGDHKEDDEDDRYIEADNFDINNDVVVNATTMATTIWTLRLKFLTRMAILVLVQRSLLVVVLVQSLNHNGSCVNLIVYE